MKLDIGKWKEFRVGDLFDIELAKGDIKFDDMMSGDIHLVSSGESDNGIVGCIDAAGDGKSEIFDGNCLTVDMFGNAFYQNEEFYAVSHGRVNILKPKFVLTEYVGLFLSTVIKQEQYKYSYGRAVYSDVARDMIIRLPVDSNGEPDWVFMEEYIKSLCCKPLTTKNHGEREGSVPVLDPSSWGEFRLDKIFYLKGGFYNKKPEHSIDGDIPFLGSTENDNGVTDHYSIDDIRAWDKVGNDDDTLKGKIFDKNCIAVTVNGSVCNAYYQSSTFTCSHDITALYLRGREMNSYIAQFLCVVIMQDKYRWSYGRKPHDIKKFGRSIIKLPIDLNGDPDWAFMENYIKSLPYGDKLVG